MTRWKPALRMARRDLWTHKRRSLLLMCLVALPVVVAVTVAQFHHNTRWQGERAARAAMGGADAVIEVTPYTAVQVSYWPSEMMWEPLTEDGSVLGERKRLTAARDATTIDPVRLLPDGTRVIDSLTYGSVPLGTGGTGHVKIIDASDPMSEGLADVSAGSAPTAADEVAITSAAAEALELVDDDGQPLAGAAIDLLDGTQVRVVGVIDPRGSSSYPGSIEMLAAPHSVVADQALAHEPTDALASSRYLVDLPDATASEMRELVDSLAAEGVAVLPRDAMHHPREWNVQGSAAPVDVTALAIGALVVLFGLIEVVLLVGSAFAVGARRQIRDLGLVAANGGASRDTRTVLLAQGLVLGAGASVLGAAVGLLTFHVSIPAYESVANVRVWTDHVDWLSVVGLTLLGAVTGLIAALVPGWSISRMSAVDALSGQFAVRDNELRASRPGVLLTAGGMLVVLSSGWWIAHEFADRDAPSGVDAMYVVSPSPVPVVVGAIGLLLLIAGITWLAPHVVRHVAGGAGYLSVSGRLAVRDASRHRFRTAASAVTLMVAVAGMVFTGFAVQAASAQVIRDTSELGPRWLSVDVSSADTDETTGEKRLANALDAIHQHIGAAQTFVAYTPARPGAAPYAEPFLGARNTFGGAVRIVDGATLERLVRASDDVLEVFDSGGVVTTASASVSGGTARITFNPPGKKYDGRWDLPAVVTEPSDVGNGIEMPDAWMSAATAESLGFVPTPSTVTVLAERDLTADDLDALGVRGISASSAVRELEQVGLLRFAALGGAALLTLLIVGIAVALTSAEGRADQATMAAIGAGRRHRRLIGAMHGMFIGVVGALLGTVVGLPAGAALMQVDGAPGTPIPWLMLLAVPLIPLLAWVAGWVATPTRLTLVRRTD